MATNVLVTGANGQLARTMKELYAQNKDNIHFRFVTKSNLDITDKDKVNDHFESYDYDYCINCAAYTHVEQAEKTPEKAFAINAEGVRNLAQACQSNNVALIHISTDYVFDGNKHEPYTEEDSPNPINEYGKSKLLGEQYIGELMDNYYIIRSSWLYSKYGNNFVNTVINKLQEKVKLSITTSQVGAPTSCKDLSMFIYFLIEKKVYKYGTYHFSGEEGITWFDFANEIVKNLENPILSEIFPVEEFYSSAKRPKYSVLDNSKARSIHNYTSNWKKEVREVVTELKNKEQIS